jgi:D-alanyl-lipoteichoic acid acyltransferase DltB (MBOAT superfamily)
MLFNSFEYAVFLPLAFLLYWFVFNKQVKLQNIFLLVAGYLFYGWWDWRFLCLLFLSSTIDYIIGIQLSTIGTEKYRKLLLLISITFNLCMLGFFKYFNFFSTSFTVLLTNLGFQVHPTTINVILPVGISFYTFQSLSYTIDIYKRRMNPTSDPFTFYAFVSFFPQLVAGPIERGIRLIPQFSTPRTFNYTKAVDGMRQILWGLFKKIVIADNCADSVNLIFSNSQNYSGSTLFLGAILFAFQIYCDFSGYSDIAIGTARLFGFDLMQNFAFPYFSRDIAEFWRRWHISLSTWFRDYIYIPLGGSRVNTLLNIRNTFVVFIVSGFWHGANWTFIIWGFLHAIYFLPLLLFKTNRKNLKPINQARLVPEVGDLLSIATTFFFVTIAWVFFRAENINSALIYLSRVFSKSLFSAPEILPIKLILPLLILFFSEWINRNKQHGLMISDIIKSSYLRWIFYTMLIFMIMVLGGKQQTFIYFQF